MKVKITENELQNIIKDSINEALDEGQFANWIGRQAGKVANWWSNQWNDARNGYRSVRNGYQPQYDEDDYMYQSPQSATDAQAAPQNAPAQDAQAAPQQNTTPQYTWGNRSRIKTVSDAINYYENGRGARDIGGPAARNIAAILRDYQQKTGVNESRLYGIIDENIKKVLKESVADNGRHFDKALDKLNTHSLIQ